MPLHEHDDGPAWVTVPKNVFSQQHRGGLVAAALALFRSRAPPLQPIPFVEDFLGPTLLTGGQLLLAGGTAAAADAAADAAAAAAEAAAAAVG